VGQISNHRIVFIFGTDGVDPKPIPADSLFLPSVASTAQIGLANPEEKLVLCEPETL
jgi:hypothetical protein